MSDLFQISVFRVLEEDHQWYLKPYDDEENFKLDKVTSGCKNLAKKINSICSFYTSDTQFEEARVNKRNLSEGTAAVIIKHFLQRVSDRGLFKRIKKYIKELEKKNPVKVLALVNGIHAQLFERNRFKLVFRLDGRIFPPYIVYKLIPKTYLNIIDMRTQGSGIENKNIYEVWHQFKYYKCCACRSFVKSKPVKKKKTRLKRSTTTTNCICPH